MVNAVSRDYPLFEMQSGLSRATLEPGKDADIVVWDGDPLDARTNVRLTFVNGEVAYRA